MSKHKKKGNSFRFTASYSPLITFTDQDDLRKKWADLHQQRLRGIQECRPLPALPKEDLETILSHGVNDFHIHGWSPDAETVTSLLKSGYTILSYVDDYYYLSPQTTPDQLDIEGILDQIRERFVGHKGDFLLCAAVEADCPFAGEGCPFPDSVKSRQEAYEIYKQWFWSPKFFFRHYHEYCRKKGIDLGEFNVVVGIHEQWHHYAAEWGAGLLFSEGNCNLPNGQVHTAFLRGAARQYDKQWFLYWSSFGGVNRMGTLYDSEGQLKSGPSDSLMLREWLMSFYAGADICGGIEMPANQLFCVSKDGKRKKTKLAKAAKDFADLVFHRHPDRGEPYVPVAIMLDYYHGWRPREHRVWADALPYTRDEEMIDNFFNAAFPNQEKSCFPFVHQPWRNKTFPWSSMKECMEMWESGKIDPRIYEKGFLVDSTWGDSFDVVLDNCPLSVLKQYKAVFLLGSVKLKGELKKKLVEYVKQGGTLLVNCTQVNKNHPKFFGVEFLDRGEYLGEIRCHDCGRGFRDGMSKLEMVRPTTASVLLKAVDPYTYGGHEYKRIPGYHGADPVAVSNKVGKGQVILTLQPYMQTSATMPMNPAFCDLIDHLMEKLLPVKVDGPPIQYLINQTERGYIVTLIHNGPDYWEGEKPKPWRGQIVLRRPKQVSRRIQVRELWKDAKLRAKRKGGQLVIPLQVQPFGFKIVAIEGRG